ncbi:MAG: DUF2541 domain-containing protein [Hyphomicrobiaceae bacterium]|nr:DUF2541 domain-containing protein [Hyphomicrobiaceae bacterium]
MYGRLLALALALCAWGQATAASAQVEVTLAEEKARRIIPDIDRIDTRGVPGKFRGIRVYALDGSAVDIAKIDVKYSDGSTFTEDRGRPIRLDERDVRTRIMGPNDGNGPEKFIDQIVMHYKAAPGEPRQARIRIVGITSNSGARAERPQGGVAAPVVVPGRPGDSATSGQVPSRPTTPTPTSTSPGSTTAGGDVLFGVQYVGFGVDRDVIKVGREYGKFDKIRLRVLDNDIYINEMRVVYTNGEPDVLAVDANVAANSRTKWFALKGDRFIKEIQLVYRSRPNFKGQARIEVFGEFAEGWYGSASSGGTPSGEAFKHGSNRGWLYLGGQQPKFFSVSLKKGIGYETDVISVARNWGFNRMRLEVKDRAITLNKITVVYGDGTSDTIPVGQKVDGGASYGPVQLNRKPVKEIQVSYRSRVFDKNASGNAHAFVEFWAQ